MGEFDFLNDTEEISVNKKNDSNSNNVEKVQQNIEKQPPKKFSNHEEFKKHCKEISNKAKYDPRPEFELHYIWKKLLQLAEKQDNETYNLLHYLRCNRCKLQLARDKANNSHPILKLDLDNSIYLLEQHMNDEELKIGDESNYEQMQLLNTGDDVYSKVARQKQRARKLVERKKELRGVAKQRILDEIVLPKLKEVKLVFDMMKPSLKKAENDVGVISFSSKAYNDYLERKERGYV